MSTTNQQRYVAGFLFTPDLERVAMIHKLRPAWQKDRLNAIGGKINDGETHIAAMVREFSEETGVHTTADFWSRFCMLEFPDAVVHFFVAVQDESDSTRLVSMTDEQVDWHSVSSLKTGWIDCIDNIPQLLELALQYVRFTQTHQHA